MRKRLTALLLCLCMVLTMLPVSAMAAVGDLLGNTPEQNASLLEKLESFTGESAEEAQQLLDSLGLFDEDGNLITDQTIDLDGKQYTLEEMEALLADPSTDLTRVAQVDGVPSPYRTCRPSWPSSGSCSTCRRRISPAAPSPARPGRTSTAC